MKENTSTECNQDSDFSGTQNELENKNDEIEYALLEFPEENAVDIYKVAIIRDWDPKKPPDEGSEVLVNWKKSIVSAKVIKLACTKLELVPLRENMLDETIKSEVQEKDSEAGDEEYTSASRSQMKRNVKSNTRKRTKIVNHCQNKKKTKLEEKNIKDQGNRKMQELIRSNIASTKIEDTKTKQLVDISCNSCETSISTLNSLQDKCNAIEKKIDKVGDFLREMFAFMQEKYPKDKGLATTKTPKLKTMPDSEIQLGNNYFTNEDQMFLEKDNKLEPRKQILSETPKAASSSMENFDSLLDATKFTLETSVLPDPKSPLNTSVSNVHEHLKYSASDSDESYFLSVVILKTSHKVVELVNGSKVFLPRFILRRAENSSKTASTMARLLLVETFKLEFLRTCSLYGRTANGPHGKPADSRQGLYRPAVDAIIDFVLDIASKRNWKECKKDIVRTLGNKLSELRREEINAKN